MEGYFTVNLQANFGEIIDKIIEKRDERNGFRDTKTRVVSEAINKLAEEELGE